MLPIGRHDSVFQGERLHGPDTGRFFADIKVKETMNLLQAVHFRSLFLETSDAQHLAEQE
jgi:hypothetical protein